MTSDPEFEPESDEVRLVTVFVTGKIIAFDMAVDVLKRHASPFRLRKRRAPA